MRGAILMASGLVPNAVRTLIIDEIYSLFAVVDIIYQRGLHSQAGRFEE
jgi:hypothetical protein